MGSVCQMTIENVFQVEQTHGQTRRESEERDQKCRFVTMSKDNYFVSDAA